MSLVWHNQTSREEMKILSPEHVNPLSSVNDVSKKPTSSDFFSFWFSLANRLVSNLVHELRGTNSTGNCHVVYLEQGNFSANLETAAAIARDRLQRELANYSTDRCTSYGLWILSHENSMVHIRLGWRLIKFTCEIDSVNGCSPGVSGTNAVGSPSCYSTSSNNVLDHSNMK